MCAVRRECVGSQAPDNCCATIHHSRCCFFSHHYLLLDVEDACNYTLGWYLYKELLTIADR